MVISWLQKDISNIYDVMLIKEKNQCWQQKSHVTGDKKNVLYDNFLITSFFENLYGLVKYCNFKE